MGHPPGAVWLPSPSHAWLAGAVERVPARHGGEPTELAELLRAADAPPAGTQLAAIAWVLDPDARHVLLVHHREYGWSCPGGHVEGDEDPAATAARELSEETGLVLEPDGPVSVSLGGLSGGDRPHRHWLLGYRFQADPTTPLVAEEDPVAWHAVDSLPTPNVADLAPLLAAIVAASASPPGH
jgi:8-oxo-dGTP pyrophosphatase MutT (NUDIX family)